MLPFMLQKGLYRWLRSKQLPVTLNPGCRARREMRQIISDILGEVVALSQKARDISKYFLHTVRYRVQFSSADTCYGMQISDVADGGEMITCFNISSRHGWVSWLMYLDLREFLTTVITFGHSNAVGR